MLPDAIRKHQYQNENDPLDEEMAQIDVPALSGVEDVYGLAQQDEKE